MESIKSCGDLSRTATEPLGRGANLRKEGIWPLGGKPTLVLPDVSTSSARGSSVFTNQQLVEYSAIWRTCEQNQDRGELECGPIQASDGVGETDFTMEHHGSVVLLRPNTPDGIDWANAKIGKDNGFQPYWPTIVLEPRYVSQVVNDIHKDGLIAR